MTDFPTARVVVPTYDSNSTAPRTIWAAHRKHSGWQFAACADQPFDGGTRYHHDAVVRELVEALEFYAVLANWKRNGPLDASSSFFTGGPAPAALAKIAQDATQ